MQSDTAGLSAEASLTSGRRPSGVGGNYSKTRPCLQGQVGGRFGPSGAGSGRVGRLGLSGVGEGCSRAG